MECDYDFQILNGSAWNYAIHLTDDDNVDQAFKFMNTGLKSGISPFSVLGAPSKIVAIVSCLTFFILGSLQFIISVILLIH